MQIKDGSFTKMAEDIIAGKNKIVIFGTGVIGTTVTPEILIQYGLDSFVECYIDNDKARWGNEIAIGNRMIGICSPDVLYRFSGGTTILLTMSRYSGAYEQLLSMNCTERMSSYIIPKLCIDNFHTNESNGVRKMTEKPEIPKKIHYMWLGKTSIPDKLKKCMDSWNHYCPDYEIVQWNEMNYNVEKCLYMKQAYETGKYGFVPDYARLDILYHYGGIYMDTDVELIKNIDDLLYQQAFCSVEKWQVINFGGCSGSVKGHPSIKKFLEAWEMRRYYREDGTPDPISSGIVDTQVALDNGYVINGQNQTIMGMNVYTYDYFHPYDYMSKKFEKTDNTFAIHHFNGGWII